METLKVGDSALYTTSLGNSYSVVIVGLLEGGGYMCKQDGVYIAPSREPDLHVRDGITTILDELKRPFRHTGKGWSSLKPRAPEPGDDEKRAAWDARVKKYEEDIAAHWLRYTHIKPGVTVECYEYNSWTGERFLQFVGKVTHVYSSNFTCYVEDAERNERKYLLQQLRVIKEAPSEEAKHHCASPNKEPWPKCCSEASAAFSKGMEERHFQEKLNL